MIGSEDYSARYARQYAEATFETLLIRIRRKHVLAALARHPHRSILEVGCGLEPLFEFVADFQSFTVVERSVEFFESARARTAARSGIQIIQGCLEDRLTELAGRDFDFIVVSSLLHEVSDPSRLLAAARALSGPGTTIHFNVPNVRSFHRLLALEAGLIDDVFDQSETDRQFHRRTGFDRDHLLRMLEAASFRVVECGTYFVKPFTHAQMDILLRSGALAPAVLDGLDRMTKYMPELGCEIYADAKIA